MIQYHHTLYKEIINYEYNEEDYSMDTDHLIQLAEKVRNLSNTLGQVAQQARKGEQIIAEKPLWQQRQEICDTCPHFKIPGGICKKCGCFMKVKTKIQTAKCPLDKW